MISYETTREKYKPIVVKALIIAESPPPAADVVESSRQFYRTEYTYPDDRLFINTIRALYPEAMDIPAQELEQAKEHWLRRFQADGWYMIEALAGSQPHETTKKQRQERIREQLPHLLERVAKLATPGTKIMLVKSNVFIVAAEPLRQAGFTVLNTALLDYPGRFNQRAYREKLAAYQKLI